MASLPAKILLFILYLVQSQAVRFNLDASDASALLHLKNDLGFFRGQLHQQRSNPCNSAGISCQENLSGKSPALRVIRISFESGGLTGSLSSAIGLLSELKHLSLANNQLVDRIPQEIVDCRKLEVLNIRNNRFSGEIPMELSSLVSLRVLDLSSNQFSGDLSFLKHFPNLEELYLSDNFFSGKIPASLRSFRNLRFLNISGNGNLQGPVPVLLNNHLESSSLSLPRRYRLAETNTNRKQGSAVAPSASKTHRLTAPAPSPSVKTSPIHHKKHHRSLRGWIFGFLAGVVAGMVSGLILSVLYKVALVCIRGRNTGTGPAIFSPLIKKAEDLAFLEKDDAIASLEVIGRGGCGEVYRAELPGSNGKMIAIKKIIHPAIDATDLAEEDSNRLNKRLRQIQSEIKTVGHIRHRNLLPLLAHVSRPDCHYLIYEFMKNGSLHDALKEVSEGRRELDWLLRHRIAFGVAAGLEYLHMNHSPKIIHRDLKPANILLDDDMEARIADFGLAKAVPDTNTHVTTSNVAGTVGFIAPEYHQTYKFTEKCDIYSFGVVLAVLVMGKLPSDEFFQQTDEMSQVKWLRNVITSENPSRAIDPKLKGNGYEEQMLLVLKIACFCTLDDPKQRPNSKDVRCMLSQVKQ